MHFGLFFLMDAPRETSFPELIEETLDTARRAEELGFESAWIAEHHYVEGGGQLPLPLMFAVKLAGATERMRLGTAVKVLSLDHPMRTLEETALADVLTGGRIELGVGSGTAAHEFRVLGLPHEEKSARFREALDIILKAWSNGQRFSYSGRYFQVPETIVTPRPLQRPHPPIWVAAGSPESVAMAAQNNLPLMQSTNTWPLAETRKFCEQYRGHMQRLGRGQPILLNRLVYVAPTDEQARRDAERGAMARLERTFEVLYPERKQSLRGAITFETMQGDMFTLGSPETCIENIRMLRDEVGIDYLICKFNMAGVSPERSLRSMELFSREVMPAFKEH